MAITIDAGQHDVLYRLLHRFGGIDEAPTALDRSDYPDAVRLVRRPLRCRDSSKTSVAASATHTVFELTMSAEELRPLLSHLQQMSIDAVEAYLARPREDERHTAIRRPGRSGGLRPAAERPLDRGNGGTEMSTITKKENPSEQKAIDALGATEGEVTVDELAAAAGIGRTSARKYLAALEVAGKVKRTAGGRDGKRKLPDRYSPIPGEEPPGEGAVVDEPSDDGPAERLRPGELDGLVLDYLKKHSREPLGPSAVAKSLQRSSGAVANSLARLTRDERVRQVGERPRRYLSYDEP